MIQNLYLLALDFSIFLPITLIRLVLIYFFGSRYNIQSLQFLDIMMHAKNKYFNQENEVIEIDTEECDIRESVRMSSLLENDYIQEFPLIEKRETKEEILNNNAVNREEIESIVKKIISEDTQLNNIKEMETKIVEKIEKIEEEMPIMKVSEDNINDYIKEIKEIENNDNNKLISKSVSEDSNPFKILNDRMNNTGLEATDLDLDDFIINNKEEEESNKLYNSLNLDENDEIITQTENDLDNFLK